MRHHMSYKRGLVVTIVLLIMILLGGQSTTADAQTADVYGADPSAPADSVYVSADGRVGIGTEKPKAQLHVMGPIQVDVPVEWDPITYRDGIYDEFVAGQWPNRDWSNFSERELRIQSGSSKGAHNQYIIFNGRITNYTRYEQQPEPEPVLDIMQGKWGRFIGLEFYNDGHLSFLVTGDGDTYSAGTARPIKAQRALTIQSTGHIGIGQVHPEARLNVEGTTRTGILQITGGSDLAEPFEITDGHAVSPGMVVVIDPEQPGQLRIANSAYDHRVAGVVSGAGGVQPGLVMQQEGTLMAGSHPVALTGRVYVLADTTNGSIEPGDLLTTSDVPGHAMKATDREQAFGATLGKAMSPLHEGTGLVLVLIALQ